jgi:hypothetical protein
MYFQWPIYASARFNAFEVELPCIYRITYICLLPWLVWAGFHPGRAAINDSIYPSDMILGVQIKQHKENLLHKYDLPLQRVPWKIP